MDRTPHDFSRSIVLVADDDPTVRCLISETLIGAGFTVEEAEDGNQALALLNVIRADLIVLDVTMPGKNGFEVCQNLRSNSLYASIPILMVTGHDDMESINHAFHVGASDFLTKPINCELLPHRVLYLLRAAWEEKERKRAQDEVLRLNLQTQQLLNSAGEGICGLDMKGQVIFANAHSAHLLRYDPAELIGRAIHTVVYNISADDFSHDVSTFPIYSALFNKTQRHCDDEVFQRKDGSLFQVEYVCTPTMLGDEPTGAVIVFRDITARKTMEQRERTHALITRILAESASVHDALSLVAESICHSLDWDFGVVWNLTRDGTHQQCATVSQEATITKGYDQPTEHLEGPYEWEVDLPGQVWQTGLPVWSNNIQNQRSSYGTPGIGETEMHVGVGFPIRMGEHLQGVMAFFHRAHRERDDELLHLFSAIGSQIGQFHERKQAEEALKESQGQLTQAQRIAQLGYWNLDLVTNTFRVSEEMSRLLGTTAERFSGTYDEFLSRIHPNDQMERAQIIQDALISRSSFSLEYRIAGQDSEERMMSELGELVMDEFGRPTQITGVIQDITDRKFKENQIHTLSHYDSLTSLPNRVMFQNLLEQALASSHRQEDSVALLLLNIDRFTRINETLGHKTGDHLLQEVGKRLLRSIRRSDTLARQTDMGSATSISRFGGDEFMILLTNFKSLDNPAKVARRILSRLGQSFVLGTQEIFLTASIGISIFPNDGETEEILLRNAQISMQHAKDNGRNTYHYFSPSMNVSSFAKLTMENSLYKALERNELVLYYQPQIDILRREIIGVEALMRWNHPERGIVSPSEFIPLAEESGLIKSIGEWALRTASRQHQTWQDQGLPPIRIGVNLSSLQFRDQELVSTIETVLKDGSLDPQFLELELTEGIVMRDAEETMLTLNYLKKLGIHLAIDDFGTGYSSLSYLRRFPLDKIKIDRAFIIDITRNVQDSSITKAIIALGHSLNLRVIAEGVETHDQFLHLEYLGCDEIQGYLFSPPVPPDQIPELFRGQASFAQLTSADI